MPKISAASVVEHRARQRAALLAAARDLLLDAGYAGLTFAALAGRTGLARPTVYSYFDTKDDVIVALCEVELPLVRADVERLVAAASDPREKLAAFVRAQLGAARQRRHRIAHVLADAPLSDEARRRIGGLHRELMPSAAPILAELGHPHPELAAMLVQGQINAAVTALDAGQPVRRVQRATLDSVLRGFG